MQSELLTRFSAIVGSGDENAARAFLIEHFLEFPEDIQEGIAFAFLQEELQEGEARRAAVRDLQAKALAVLGELTRVREDIENENRIDEIRTDLDIKD